MRFFYIGNIATLVKREELCYSYFNYKHQENSMFAIICLNIMLLISCWYLIAENQKNKTKINSIQDDLNKAIKRLATLEEEGVTQKS